MALAVARNVDCRYGFSSSASVPPQKDFFDHIAEYTASTAGAWDLFYVIDHALSHLRLLPSLPDSSSRLIGRVSRAVGVIGLALSIPELISDCNTVRNSVARFIELNKKQSIEPLDRRRVFQATKGIVLNALTLTNTLTYIPAFLEHLNKGLFDARNLLFFDGVYNVTSIVLDGAELIEEGFKLNAYASLESKAKTPVEQQQIEEKKCLSWMCVAKGVSSVALSVIALVVLLTGVAVEGAAIIAVGVLALSSFWLVTKIVSYFYYQIVVEPHSKNSLSGLSV